MVRKRRRGQISSAGTGPFTWFNLMLYVVALVAIVVFYWQIGQKTAGCFGVLSDPGQNLPLDSTGGHQPIDAGHPMGN